MRIDGFEVTFTSFPEGRTYTPPKGDVCALRGNEKATQFNERTQMAKCPAGRTAFRFSALLKVEMPKCASPKRSTKNRDDPFRFFTAFSFRQCPNGGLK